MTTRLWLGFDFLDAGNIGDDLMLDGFLRAVGDADVLAAAPSEDAIARQQRRFARAQWLAPNAFTRRAIGPGDAWVGVGATPFQHSIGPWALNWLEAHAAHIRAFPRRVLVGVGAEHELGAEETRFAAIARLFDRIVTRDRHSHDVLTQQLCIDPGRISVGADLAHIALPALVPDGRPTFDLGLVPVADRGESGVHEAIAALLRSLDSSAAICANEVRPMPGLEIDLAGAVRRVMPDDALALLTPPYSDGSMRDLLMPLAQCNTIISWRYHALLIAAWLGRPVAAVARSSKVHALARELGVPYRHAPVNDTDLRELCEEAHPVVPARLRFLHDRAHWGVHAALDDAPPDEPRQMLAPVGPHLATVAELRSQPFVAFMARLNRFARAHDLREFDTWSKVWEYPWLWYNVLGAIEWPGTHLVDIGAERSPMPWLLATLGARITMTETDAQFIGLWEGLRRTLGVDAQWHIVTDASLPVARADADVVTSLSVVEHQPDKRRAIDEIARVLRPGGVLAMSFDICEPAMGMQFPAWNGEALSMSTYDEVIGSHEAFEHAHDAWNTDAIPAYLDWHRTTAPHHTYVTGASVLVRRA